MSNTELNFFCKSLRKILRKHRCLCEFRKNLKITHNETIYEFVKMVSESDFLKFGELITYSFVWPDINYGLWKKISNEWKEHVESLGYAEDYICTSSGDQENPVW